MNDLIEKLNSLGDYLRERIRGQDHVIERMVSVVKRGELGLYPEGEPKASVLFLGPTGVGKTELTKQITKFIFGAELLYRFDMSEFLHVDQVKLFTGDETGQTGRLGTVLSEHRRGVLLFDEIEKAHHLIWDLFLQMIADARITLADHKTYDLSGFYLVFTSNIGSSYLLRPTRLPFVTLEKSVLGKLERTFRPELVGRFTDKIVFRPLGLDTQYEIAKQVIAAQLEIFRRKGFGDLEVGPNALEFLVRAGYNPTLGARPMRQVVAKYLGDAVASSVLSSSKPSGAFDVLPNHSALVLKSTYSYEDKT
jgi:ATP-dependent Clp protease ATP-binding subunit ClpA